MLSLGFAHTLLDQELNWRRELARLSAVNRQLFFLHTFYTAFVMVLFGTLCVFGTKSLLEQSSLAEWILGGMVFYWLTRLLFQVFASPLETWRSKQLWTRAHLVVSLASLYLVFVFSWAWWLQVSGSAVVTAPIR